MKGKSNYYTIIHMGCGYQPTLDELGPRLYSITEAPTRIRYLQSSHQTLHKQIHKQASPLPQLISLSQSIQNKISHIDQNYSLLHTDKLALEELLLDVHADLDKADRILYQSNFAVHRARLVIDRLNALRSNPAPFINTLRNQLAQFQSDNQTVRLFGQRVITYEGKKAWIEGVEYLQQQSAKGHIRHMWQLSKFSFDHCRDMVQNSYFDHKKSTEAEGALQRLKKYVNTSGNVGILLNEGSKDIDEALLELVVDDGNSTRSNRASLFSEFYVLGGGYLFEDKLSVVLIEGMK